MLSIKALARKHAKNYSTVHRRINEYGFTREEAVNCPSRTPLWMYRIEREEETPMKWLLEDAAKTAHETGYTLRDLAREWGVNHSTLGYWAEKWGIKFPRGASAVQKEKAAEIIATVNERRLRLDYKGSC